MNKKSYKIGMFCRKHSGCDLVAPHEGIKICTGKHFFELYNSEHKYDLVFTTHKPEMWGLKNNE